MGFWDDPKIKQAEQSRGKPAAKKKTAPSTKAAPLATGARGCDACSLKQEWPRITSQQMACTGNLIDGDILVLGDIPSKEDDRKGEQFIDKTGNVLRNNIPGREQDRLVFQNTVRCRPYDGRVPTSQEAYACSAHLDHDIKQMPNIKAILGAGAVPLSRFITESNILNIHGTRFPVAVGGRTLWYYPIMHPSFVERLQSDRGYDGPAMPVFRADIRKFFQEVDEWPKPRIHNIDPSSVQIARTREQAESLVLAMQEPIAVDIETADANGNGTLKPYYPGAHIVSASFSDGKTTVSFWIDSTHGKNDWALDFLLTVIAEVEWIAHNAAFEVLWFLYYCKGRKQPAPFQDSMAVARIYHERERLLELGLVSRIHLGVNVKRVVQVNTQRIEHNDPDKILQYNGLDALASALVFRKLIKHVDYEQYEQLLMRIESFAYMELMGLSVSEAAALELQTRWLKQAADARATAKDIYEVKEYTRRRGVEFDISSPVHVGEALVEYGKVPLPKTAKGKQYSTDDDVLRQIAPGNPLVVTTMEYRDAVKMESVYITPVIEARKQSIDGMIHPSYTVCRVSTYRSSSADPNAQNYPKRKHKELRSPIIAPEGHLLVACDMGQCQVRILACASEDHILIKSLLEGRDIHTDWLNNLIEFHPDYLDHLAAQTGQQDEAKIRKYGRSVIKSDLVFNAFFGGGAQNISTRTGIPLRVAEEILVEFWEEFRGVKAWHKARRNEYRDTGTVKGMTGIMLGRNMKTGNEPINFPIQNGEAELVMRAQCELSQLAIQENDMYYQPRINVHDDLTFVLPDDDRIMGYIDRITQSMSKVWFEWQIVPSVVEVQVGPNWADLQEVLVVTGDYVR
jgi:uracil-DNA glycosylase family 4